MYWRDLISALAALRISHRTGYIGFGPGTAQIVKGDLHRCWIYLSLALYALFYQFLLDFVHFPLFYSFDFWNDADGFEPILTHGAKPWLVLHGWMFLGCVALRTKNAWFFELPQADWVIPHQMFRQIVALPASVRSRQLNARLIFQMNSTQRVYMSSLDPLNG